MGYDYCINPVLAGTLAYWRGKRAGRALPSRRDIDPVEVPALLPHLQLIETAAGRFRYRLIGTALAEAFGRDYTGHYLDELFAGGRADTMGDVYRSIVETRRPAFLRSRYLTTKSVDLVANRLYLPLSDDGEQVNMILGALTFEFGALESVSGVWGTARLAPAGTEFELVDADCGD